MAWIWADRVLDTSVTAGTGALTVSGSSPLGWRTFSTVCAVADQFYYTIFDPITGAWETGEGSYSATNTVTRSTVRASTNANALVNFAANAKNVFIDVIGYWFGTTLPGSYLPLAGGTLTGALTGTTARFASGANGAVQVLFSGLTKGIRFGFDTVASYIEGVDVTGVASYQPLILNGSIVQLSTSLTGTLATFSGLVTAQSVEIVSNNPAQKMRTSAATVGWRTGSTITGTTDGYWYLQHSTDNFVANFLNAMQVDQTTGGLGLGGAPTQKLDLIGPAGTALYTRWSDGTRALLTGISAGSQPLIGTITNHPLAIFVNNADVLRVTPAVGFHPTADNTQANGTAALRWASIVGAEIVARGAGQTVANYDPAGTQDSSIWLTDTGTAVGTGGAVVFADGFGPFAAIKGYATSGTGPVGDLVFSTRRLGADTTFTEIMRFVGAGSITLNGLLTGQAANFTGNGTFARLGIGMNPNATATSTLWSTGDVTLNGANHALMGNIYFDTGWKYTAGGATAAAVKLGIDATTAYQLLVAPNNAGAAGAVATPIVVMSVTGAAGNVDFPGPVVTGGPNTARWQISGNTFSLFGSGGVNTVILQHDNTHAYLRPQNAGSFLFLGGAGANSSFVANNGIYPATTKTMTLGNSTNVWNTLHVAGTWFYGATSGQMLLQTAAVASGTQTLPAGTGTVALLDVGTTPPATPADAHLWYNSDGSAGGGQLYVRFNDGNTTQWVPASPAAASSNTVLQTVSTETGAVATGTTLIPSDDTIPQITEGNEYMTVTITPKLATSRLKIEVTWIGSNTMAPGQMVVALFQDANANALAAVPLHPPIAQGLINVKFTHMMTSGTVSATTFRVRAGGNTAGTTTFNGVNGARELGGVMASSIVIQEVA